MPDALKFTDQEIDAFRKAYAPAGATDEQWQLFINECQRRALVPGVHVVFQLRSAKEYDKDLQRDVFVKKVTFITTINALRLIAQRDGHYEGHGPFVYYYGTEDGDLKESKIPLGKVPHAVAVEGFRKGWRVPLFATARYDAYVQKFGKDDGVKKPTQMWATRGEEQLAKCCEALMLRTVCPEECANLLINEELGADGVIDKEDIDQPVTPAVVPLPTIAPLVNQGCGSATTPPELQPPNVTVMLATDTPKETVQVSPAPTVLSEPVAEPEKKLPVPIKPGEFKKEDGGMFPPMKPATPLPAPAAKTDSAAPATRNEYDAFLGRSAKLVRDKLPKEGLKDSEASNGVKNYLLKGSGKTGLKQLTAADWERLLKVLEEAPAGGAAEIIRAQK